MDIENVNKATALCVERGMRVLNAFLFDETEQGHVSVLLDLMQASHGAVVLDAGCGLGEVALLMRDLRPDLTFKLLNIIPEQLEQCPEDMEQILADFSSMPLSDASVDIVMFNFALCHAHDVGAVLQEARRVVKEGGVVFINDMSRESGDNPLMQVGLNARAHTIGAIGSWAARAGLVIEQALVHEPAVMRLRGVFESPSLYDAMFDGVVPTTWRLVRRTISDPIASAFARHQRIGFQFSGGRDSTAALYMLRPYWDRMTVYHLDTGDQFPETRAVVDRVEQDVQIVRIHSDVHAVRDRYGLASDLVPVDNTEPGRLVSGRDVRLISRYECCYRSLMEPMHARMKADGITLIVRGQRSDEYAKPPLVSGQAQDGFEVLYPIEAWSGDQVSRHLAEQGLPVAPFYEQGARRAPECMGCTAWWDEGRSAYLKANHPEAHVRFVANMAVVRREIDRQYESLKIELELP